MAVKLNTLKCPQCGAVLPFDQHKELTYCPYCGTKILMTNENEYVIRHIDEAGIRQAEAQESVRMRELDLEERKVSQNSVPKKILLGIWLFSLCLLLRSASSSLAQRTHLSSGF